MGLEVTKKTEVNVSADRLWSILADDFDKVGDWSRAVDSSGPVASGEIPEGSAMSGRVCEAPGFGAIDESFVAFDAEQRTYAFTATASKIPSFVRNITNHTSVKALGANRSEVQMTVTADLDGVRGALVKPMMARKFGGTLGGLMEDITVYAESGNISDKKTKALAKAGK